MQKPSTFQFLHLLGALAVFLPFVQAGTVVYQADAGTLSNALLRTQHSGYQGLGYADYSDSGGGSIEWSHTAASSGMANVRIRYATRNARPLDLYVDGTLATSFACLSSGAWDSWQTETSEVTMNAGTRRITLVAPGNGPNVDWLSITSDDSPVQAPIPSDRTLESVIYQAELALYGKVSILTANGGFDGTGYADFQGKGAYLIWGVDVDATSEYEITVKYASANARSCYLYVDGIRHGKFSFKYSGGWASWKTESITVTLTRGGHNIKIAAEESSGPNIDWLSLTPCDGTCSTPVVAPTPAPISPPSPSYKASSYPSKTVVASNGRLEKGEFVSSPNQQYKVGLTTSGDLVLQGSNGSTLWSAGTSPNGYRCYVQSDGNVIVRGSDNKALWTSETYDHAGAILIVDDGGRIAVAEGNIAIWFDGIPRGTYNGLPSANMNFPIRGVFYYPWYPETWRVNGQLAKFVPDLGLYSSSDPDIFADHIDSFEYAYVDLAIASWWGPETNQDRGRITMMMEEILSSNSGVKITVYHEQEREDRPSSTEIKADLDYLKKWFAWHPTWAHIDNRPVIFVYNSDGCDVAQRWMAASGGEWYVVLKLFPQFENCAVQPDHWHQYGVGEGEPLEYDGYSTTIAPGFWRADKSSPSLPRLSRAEWCNNVEEMVQSNQPWQLIVSFNEHGEGTGVEASSSWSSNSGYGYYLDCLHEFY